MNRWGCHLDNVNVSGSVANSHYEKFPDGRVFCIDDEIPFEAPVGWIWERFGNLVFNRDSERIPLSVSERKGLAKKYDYYGASGVIDKVDRPLFNIPLLLVGEDGANLINRSTPIAFIAKGEYWVNNHAHVIDCRRLLELEYLCLYINAIPLTPYVTGTAQPKMNQEKMNSILIAVPPTDEQRRIVKKYNEIEPLISKYSHAQVRMEKLNKDIYEKIKKSILQEAIQGKLVPQEPTDEPASVLLDRIRVEKQKLLKDGKLKKKDIVDSIIFKGDDNKYYETIGGKALEISEEIPFDIPESWAWVRLGSVVTNEAGLAYSKDCLTDRSQPLIRVLRGGNIEEGRWSIKDDDVIISKKYVKDSLLLKRGTFITPAVTSIERMAKTALIQEDHHDIVVGGFVLKIKPVIIDNALLQYLNLFFQSTYYKKYCISITNKSGQAFYNLSRQKLMQCLVPIPPEKEQFRIADKYSQLTL